MTLIINFNDGTTLCKDMDDDWDLVGIINGWKRSDGFYHAANGMRSYYPWHSIKSVHTPEVKM